MDSVQERGTNSNDVVSHLEKNLNSCGTKGPVIEKYQTIVGEKCLI